MDKVSSQNLSANAAAIYRIKIRGAINPSFTDMFGNVTMHASGVDLENPITTLTVTVADQAALAGIMNYLFMFNLPILSVEYLEVVSGSASSTGPS